MSGLKDFLRYLQAQVDNGSIYVWGAQGQRADADFIARHESGANRRRALALYKKRLAAGLAPGGILAFDCSGLGMYWLYNKMRLYAGDKNANGMMGCCKMISQGELRRGDWVFRRYLTGRRRAYHIGYVADDGWNVIEARGRAYGVVKRPLTAGSWNAFGRPAIFSEEIAGGAAQLLRTLKKGMIGADAARLQLLLNARGAQLAVDGEFGSKTRAALMAFQRAQGLTADGIAAGATLAALAEK